MEDSSQRQRPPLLRGPYDLLVVGGGINGVAIARDANLRGKSVALIERGDFAAGTSSATSKMVHGGIRYLERLQLGLVFESLRERYRLLRLAPHLVRAQSFLLPVYSDSKRKPWMIRSGLFLYDKLALGRRLGKSIFLSREATLARAPGLLEDGLLGGGIYWDAVMDDARLCLANAQACAEEGRGGATASVVRNYTELLNYEDASPKNARVRDRLTGIETNVEAHAIVRALGPWTEDDLLVRSKGVHITFPAWPTEDGLLLTHSRDGRVFFVIPWFDHMVIGTTETPVDGPLDDLKVTPEEVGYLLGELRRVFPKLEVSAKDIAGTFAGVRPLARSPRSSRQDTGAVSRKHRIEETGTGVLTVVGGKYTTYRAVACDVVNRLYPGTACTTGRIPLPGGEAGSWSQSRGRFTVALEVFGVDQARRLYGIYGCRLEKIAKLVTEDETLAQPVCPASTTLRAEVLHSIREEFVVYPEDFLRRRTRLRFQGDGGRAAYAEVERMIREHARSLPGDLEAAQARYFGALDRDDRLLEMLE